MPARHATALFIALAACVALIHGHVLTFGLRLDDYLVLRPWTGAELASVWHGSWDPLQFEPHYFRPLTAWTYAAEFFVFGLNAWPMHALSLAMLVAVAWLLAMFLWTETRPARPDQPNAGPVDQTSGPLFPWIAFLGGALYVAHPCVLHGETAWVLDQMHLMSSLCVLLALRAWQRHRAGALRRWWAVACWIATGTLVKEDVVM